MILSDYAIKFRTAVFVFLVVLVLAGVSSYIRLPREGMPDVTIPHVFVTAVYEGTAPGEMEKLIAVPLERQLNDADGVKEIHSVSQESVAMVDIEFLAGEDIDLAKQRVKDKVDLSRPDLPEDLDEPVVEAFNVSTDYPIFIFAISGRTSLERLRKIAEDLQEDVELLSGVKQADISGVREREIRVEVDLPRLVAYDVPLGLLMQRIREENSTVSAGNIEVGGNKFQVRVPGEFVLCADIRDLLVVERNGQPVYLSDVARVSDTYKDLSSISRLNGAPCVSLSVMKRTGENSVALIEAIKETVSNRAMPPGVALTVVYDESDYVDMMIKELENNVLTGFLLVIVVLFVFMGWRNSLFVALAIPASMLIAFALMSFMDFSLNMIVLFSLVLSVGMLVDNAIVIVENTYRNKSLGLTRKEAARRGAGEVAWPVITSTLTTCAAFSPLLFWPDIMGQFMGFLPRTLIIVLSASLLVAIVINPAVCSALITGEGRKGEQKTRGRWFTSGYERLLRSALERRVPVLLIGFAFMVLTVLIFDRYGRGKELFPETEPRNATIEVKFAQGTDIGTTDAALRAIELKLREYRDIEFSLTNVGSAGGGAFAFGGSGTHVGSIHVEFLDAEDREENTLKLIEVMRADIGAVAGAEVKVEKQEEGPPTGAPVTIELSGDDFDTLSEYAGKVIQAIETVPGLVDLQDDLEEALPEFQFRVDRDRAALLGLNTGDIGIFLRTAIYGLESSRLRSDEEEYDITVRLSENQRNTLEMLDQTYIPVGAGQSVPLSSLGDVVYTGGRGAISRKDRKRVITITGNNQERGVDKILKDVRKRVGRIAMPSGYAVNYAGDDEEMREASEFLSRAFGVAVGLILVILVIQFNSAILPAVILVTVLLSFVGVMWGLLVCRLRFGVIMTGLGVISLAGIVVNNAIVLVDCIRQRRAEGMGPTDAVVAAGRLRLRPVLLTATTTILGLIPMAVGYSLQIHEWPPRIVAGAESSDWWAPMAVAVIFGLGIATVLTLVLVPVMYSLSDSLAEMLRERFAPSEQ